MNNLARFWLRAFQSQADLGIYWPNLDHIHPSLRRDRLAVAQLEREGRIIEECRLKNGNAYRIAPLKTAAILRAQDANGGQP